MLVRQVGGLDQQAGAPAPLGPDVARPPVLVRGGLRSSRSAPPRRAPTIASIARLDARELAHVPRVTLGAAARRELARAEERLLGAPVILRQVPAQAAELTPRGRGLRRRAGALRGERPGLRLGQREGAVGA